MHRVLAYRTAARSVRDASRSVATLAGQGRATELPGIGDTLQEKIVSLLQTGAIPAAERLRGKFPPGVVAITRLPGIGAKRARRLHEELGIDSPEALRRAALQQRLRTAKGFGPKFEERVLSILADEQAQRPERRLLLPAALELAETLAARLRERGPADADVQVAGSIRRSADAVKDIDLIAVSERPGELAALLRELEEVQDASTGSAGARGTTHSGAPIDLRVGTPSQRGNLLQHFTGSGAHNAALREAAVRLRLRVSEHGVQDSDGAAKRFAREEEVYAALGRAYVPPELREDRGEVQAALLSGGAGIPQLIELSDIQGDLHCHTVASDGKASIEEMASAAQQRGYSYLAITDHSASHGFGNAVSPDELRRQIERVRHLDGRLDGLRLLCGSEVNILPDGSLDYDDELLAQLDWVVASVHTSFSMGAAQMTARIVAAIEHPLVDAIGHPTGRLIGRRQPYALELDGVIEAAARTGTLLEINGNPDRRDLSDTHARAAAAAGVKLVIDSDAHRPATLANMRWGVATARRAWLRPQDVANTRGWDELQRLRKPARRRAAPDAAP